MTAPRPNLLDLRSQSQTSVARPLKSPRLHIAGDVPPELSPLDAFALQSRLLARQLEESAKAGNRVSRLPPLTITSPLVVQGRSDYFRSLSYDSHSGDEQGESPNRPLQSPRSQPHTPNGITPEVEVPSVRPQSMHPRMSHMPPPLQDYGSLPPPMPAFATGDNGGRHSSMAAVEEDDGTGMFGARRERSPSPMGGEDVFTVAQRNEDGSYGDKLQKTEQPDAETASTFDFAVGQSPPKPTAAQPVAQEQQQQQQQPAQRQPPKPLQQSHQYHQYRLSSSSMQAPPHSPQLSQASPYVGTSNLNPFSQSPEKPKTSLDLAGGSGSLAPPRTVFPKRSSSILSSPLDPTDEDGNSVMAASLHSLGAPRKLSTGSGMVSPGIGSFHRSSSFSSDMSAPLPRPSFNFSRPLSRVGTPGLESPARQASSDSHTSYSQSSLVLSDDAGNTPVSMHSEGFPDQTPQPNMDSSYIYSKFSLPRGKGIQRSGPQSPETSSAGAGQWDQPMLSPNRPFSMGGQAPPSPPTRPSSSSGASFSRPSMERTKLSTEILAPTSQPSHQSQPTQPTQSSPNPSRPSTDTSTSIESMRGRSALQGQEPGARGRTPMSVAHTTATSDSASTIKPPRTAGSLATPSEIPAEDHVTKAIALHEAGKLNESTYHLRHAARQSHPTGMLLYALACRHGWGMRANPREGAEWLRKAADCASIEIADDEALAKEGKAVNSLERKTRKAQFALSIYELGVSYMNGWGIEQDKTLALRCFEIAGSWGDPDALTEAGFCYANGVGCKKNLKTSAKFYRQAEAKGVSMVGNSWIHKSKYNDDSEPSVAAAGKEEAKIRSKSRARSIFGKKH